MRLIAAGIALLGLVAWRPAAAELPAHVAQLLLMNNVAPDSVSVFIKRVGDAGPTIAHNVNTSRNPASVMKLVTTAAALELLGADHRWQTQVLIDGTIKGNTLHGDLILKGGGDPWLVIERFWLLLRQLRARGLAHITGDLILDDNLFDRTAITGAALDGKAFRAYNTPPNALLVNYGATRFTIEPRAGALTVNADPPATTLRLANRLTSRSGSCARRGRNITLEVKHQGQHTEVAIGGSYPAHCEGAGFARTVLPHDQYVYGVFKALWQQLGGTLTGGWRYGHAPEGAQSLTRFESVSLAEAIRGINKFSNNVMARSLLLTLGAQSQGHPATPATGASAISDWLHTARVKMPALVIDNGAGLSRRARVSAAGLAALLEYTAAMAYFPEFEASLPIAGVDGSLRTRFQGIAAAGRLRLKTGQLTGVRALAGYATGRDGARWIIVILHNHPLANGPVGIDLQHQLLQSVLRP